MRVHDTFQCDRVLPLWSHISHLQTTVVKDTRPLPKVWSRLHRDLARRGHGRWSNPAIVWLPWGNHLAWETQDGWLVLYRDRLFWKVRWRSPAAPGLVTRNVNYTGLLALLRPRQWSLRTFSGRHSFLAGHPITRLGEYQLKRRGGWRFVPDADS